MVLAGRRRTIAFFIALGARLRCAIFLAPAAAVQRRRPGVVPVIGTRRAAVELQAKQIATIDNNSPPPPLRRRPPCYAQSWLRTDGCGVVRLKGIREQLAPFFEPQRFVWGVLGIFPVDTFGLMSAEKGNARNGYSEVVQRRQRIWFHTT